MIRNIQYLRAIAAMMVLLFHMAWMEGRTSRNGILSNWFSSGDAGVDLFFVISGFIMVHIQRDRIGSLKSYIGFLARRLTRIYPPYWIVSALLIPLWLLKPSMFNNYYDNKVDLLRSLLLFPQKFTPLLTVGWTLIHEVYFYLIVSIALMFGLRGRIAFGVIWFGIVSAGCIYLAEANFHSSSILKLIFSPFSLTFLLGYFLGLAQAWIQKCPNWMAWGGLALGILGLGFGSQNNPGVGVYPDNNHMFRLLIYGIPCAIVVAASIALEREASKPIKPLMLLGDSSYSLYLLHLPMLGLFYMLLGKANIREALPLVLAALVCFLICTTAAILFHRCIEVRMLRTFRSFINKC